uniref:Uncharacterized protein n=1 Tax=Anguilla anguilla TaxID=7936 RepID=A0A0E9S751_ANGAN
MARKLSLFSEIAGLIPRLVTAGVLKPIQ